MAVEDFNDANSYSVDEANMPLIDRSLDQHDVPPAESLDHARARTEATAQEAAAPRTGVLEFDIDGEPIVMDAGLAREALLYAARAEQFMQEVQGNPLVDAIARGDRAAVVSIAEQIVWQSLLENRHLPSGQVRSGSRPVSEDDFNSMLEVFKGRDRW